MQNDMIPKSREAIVGRLAALQLLPIKESQTELAVALWLRAAASGQPRTAGLRGGVSDPHCANPPRVCRTERSVAVADQVRRCFVPRKGGYLPGHPLGRGIGGDAHHR